MNFYVKFISYWKTGILHGTRDVMRKLAIRMYVAIVCKISKFIDSRYNSIYDCTKLIYCITIKSDSIQGGITKWARYGMQEVVGSSPIISKKTEERRLFYCVLNLLKICKEPTIGVRAEPMRPIGGRDAVGSVRRRPEAGAGSAWTKGRVQVRSSPKVREILTVILRKWDVIFYVDFYVAFWNQFMESPLCSSEITNFKKTLLSTFQNCSFERQLCPILSWRTGEQN